MSKAADAKALKQEKGAVQEQDSTIASVICIGAVAILIGLLRYAATHMELPEPAENKPYPDLGSFYVFYLQEHRDPMCRILHFIGTTLVFACALMEPMAILAVVSAALVGHEAFPVFRHMNHGGGEGFFLVLTFVGLCYVFLNGRMKVPLLMLAFGYAFAWGGHYAFEGNHPATFIYPTFSLLSDYLMWFKIATGQLPLWDTLPVDHGYTLNMI